jgi:predicted murein hydrolase (TIGR00659 family)
MGGRLTDIWVYLSATPLLWLTATLLAYLAAHRLYQLGGMNPLLNPVALAVAALVLVLWLSGTPYQAYFDGAQFVHFLLGPATVALAVPLYSQVGKLRRMLAPTAAGLLAGAVTAVASAVAIGWLLGASRPTLLSLAPKSITTPIAMGIAEKLGGLPSLTAVLVVCTGILGAVLAKALLDALGVRDEGVRGFSIGVAAHGIGTARAFQMSEEAGAFSGLGMGLNALVTALLFPLAYHLLGFAG